MSCIKSFLPINDKCSDELRVPNDVRTMLQFMSGVLERLCGDYIAGMCNLSVDLTPLVLLDHCSICILKQL
jgi:hypothetical protein